jgi:hypothetical protein
MRCLSLEDGVNVAAAVILQDTLFDLSASAPIAELRGVFN